MPCLPRRRRRAVRRSKETSPAVGSGTVVATIVRSPSRTTTIEPRPRSTWTRSTAGPSGRSAAAAPRSSSPAAASARERSSPDACVRLHRAAGSRDHGLDHLRREPDELRESGGRVHAAPEATRPCIVARRLGHHPAMRAIRATFDRFFRERGTHLAAMVAYFALASFVPADLPRALGPRLPRPGRLVERARLVPRGRLPRPVPWSRSSRSSTPCSGTRRRSSVVGAVALLWSSLSLFSALESAFNIVYGPPESPLPPRQGSRDRLHERRRSWSCSPASSWGRSATTCSAGTRADVVANQWVALALTLLSSGAALFAFLVSAYYRLTNARLTHREVLPGRDPRRGRARR